MKTLITILALLIAVPAMAATVTIPITTASNGNFSHYVVEQDGVQFTEVCEPECTEVVVQNVPNGQHSYRIGAQWANGIEWSNTQSIDVLCGPSVPIIGVPTFTCP